MEAAEARRRALENGLQRSDLFLQPRLCTSHTTSVFGKCLQRALDHSDLMLQAVEALYGAASAPPFAGSRNHIIRCGRLSRRHTSIAPPATLSTIRLLRSATP